MNCAICSCYMAWKHGLKEEGVRIPHCAGCRPRGKNCAYMKRWCTLLSANDVNVTIPNGSAEAVVIPGGSMGTDHSYNFQVVCSGNTMTATFSSHI